MQSPRNRNQTVFRNMKLGDHIKFKRRFYSHHAICSGYGNVIHLWGEGDGISGNWSTDEWNKASVREDNFYDVLGNGASEAEICKERPSRFSPTEIVRRARERIGEEGYNVLVKNCEHFANWCRHNSEFSLQVQAVVIVAAVSFAAIGVAALIWNNFVEPEAEENHNRKPAFKPCR